jgi:hypothetical protein
VTEGNSPAAGIWSEVGPPGHRIARTVLRIVVSIAVVLTLYYLLPFDRKAVSSHHHLQLARPRPRTASRRAEDGPDGHDRTNHAS